VQEAFLDEDREFVSFSHGQHWTPVNLTAPKFLTRRKMAEELGVGPLHPCAPQIFDPG
jgi:hypothetical protein